MTDRVSITICGDGGCGKSSITLRLVRSQWTHEYDPTIEDSYSVTRTVEGISYHLSLTDTAGQEEYRSLWASANLSSDAFLLVYDLTNPDSLDALSHYMEMIDIETEHRIEENSRLLKGDGGRLGDEEKQRVQPMPVKIVAGNKCDLKGERRVTARQGLEWARRRGCGFMETSAREMVNIEETFALIVRRVVEARRHSQLNPHSPYDANTPFNPTSSNPYPDELTTSHLSSPSSTSNRTSIMNLTKENALKAVGGGGSGSSSNRATKSKNAGVRSTTTTPTITSPVTATGTSLASQTRTPTSAKTPTYLNNSHTNNTAATFATNNNNNNSSNGNDNKKNKEPAAAAAATEGEKSPHLMGARRGQSTRLDGKPSRRRRSVLGRTMAWLSRLKCWGRRRTVRDKWS